MKVLLQLNSRDIGRGTHTYTGKLKDLISSQEIIIRFEDKCPEDNYDIVNIHNVRSKCSKKIIESKDCKVVISMHGEDVRCMEASTKKIIEKNEDEISFISFVSNYLRNEFHRKVKFEKKKTGVIYGGVDTEFWLPEDSASSPSRKEILFCGSFEYIKGADLLIEASRRFKRNDPLIRILGDVKWRPPDGFPANTILHGHVRKKVVCRFLQKADLFVLPSRSEAFGLSLLEAMSTGTPHVVSAVGGICEIVDPNQTGIMVPPEHPKRLARAIEELLVSSEQRREMGRRSRKVAETFPWSHTADEYAQLFKKVLG